MKRLSSTINYSFIYAKNYLGESLARHFSGLIPKPLYLALSVGTLCNLSCQQCDLWRLEGKPQKYLKTVEIKKIFKKLRRWLGPFKLTFSGAEPFIRKDILDIVSFAAQLDIYTVLSSNGWLIDRKLAEKIVDSGLDVINISLDGVHPSTHDRLRGKKGAFKRGILALENLRKAKGPKDLPVIYINTVVMNQNLDELCQLARLAQKLKIDNIRYQALESKSLFGNDPYDSQWFEKSPLWPKNVRKIEKGFADLAGLKKMGFPIKNTTNELADLTAYYKNPLEIAQKYNFCFSGVRNFAIDEYGDVKLCFGMRSVGNLLSQEPENVWYGKEAARLRQDIRSCRRYCRILPCNKREEISVLFLAFQKRIFG